MNKRRSVLAPGKVRKNGARHRLGMSVGTADPAKIRRVVLRPAGQSGMSLAVSDRGRGGGHFWKPSRPGFLHRHPYLCSPQSG